MNKRDVRRSTSNMQITEQHVTKILHLLSFGLTKGLGKQEPGQMCVEAAICAAMGLPHSDDPPCIGSAVRLAKISLNDCKWSSNMARAEGMKKLAIAQLGSDALVQESFYNKLKLNSTKRILPYLIQKHYENKKDKNLLEYKKKFENLVELNNELWEEFYHYYYNYYHYYYYYYYNYYNNNNYYNHYYNYYHYYHYYNFGNEFLLLIADTILQTLIEMKSPGCQYLHLI